jgi:superfamily II DNA or RNA helicase
MQLVEMHKVAVFVDLAETFREEGNSVPCFLNYRWPVQHVAARLKTRCIIMGGISQQERQSSLARFQNNLEHYCVLNLASGGTGIDLHNEKMEGREPRDRVSLISPGYSALQIVQAFGRTVRANSAEGARCMQYVVMIDGVDTEQKIADSISRKLTCIDQFNQNDMNLALSF